ncbi:MAG: hypothetical protein J6D31_10280 [Clostridia bacterium]|nr:hypothetical protein [Clostridia bacterium]
MKKRVLSLLLVACMLLTVLPAMALPVVAEETEATGATIKFVNANVNPQVVVDEQTLSGDVMNFTIPALPENGLGWYHMAPDGTIREASTYWGEAAADMTFYLVSSKAPFNPSTNWPVFEGSTLLGWRGGWSAGSYIADAYVPFNNIGSGILQNKSAWTYGGIYVSTQGYRMLTVAQGALALSYNAPVSGDVELDFDVLKAANVWDDGLYTDITMAIAVNGVIVWPSAAKGELVTTKSFTAAEDETYPISVFKGEGSNGSVGQVRPLTYYDIDQSNTKWAYFESLTGEAKANAVAGYKSWQEGDATCANTMVITDYLDDFDRLAATDKPAFSVEAGDRVDIVFGRVNSPHIIAHPVLTYTEVKGEAIVRDDVYTAMYASHLSLGSINWPKIANNKSDGFKDGWSFINYTDHAVKTAPFSGTTYYTSNSWTGGILWANEGYFSIRDTGSNNAVSSPEDGIGFQFVAAQGGTVTIKNSVSIVDKTSRYTNPNNYHLAIIKNGVVIYPTGVEDTDPKTQLGAFMEKGKTHHHTVTGVTVEPGDTILFLYRAEDKVKTGDTEPDDYTNDWGANWETCDLYGFSADIIYTEATRYSSVYDPVSGRNAPTGLVQSGSAVTYHGNWEIVSHGLSTYDKAVALTEVFLADAINQRASFPGALKIDSNYWGGNYPFVLNDTNTTAWNCPYGVVPVKKYSAGWSYTAEFTGTVDLNVSSFKANMNGSYVGVFVNGKMVWPCSEPANGTNYYADTYSVTTGEGEDAVTTVHPKYWAKVPANFAECAAALFSGNVTVGDGSIAANGSLTGIQVNQGDKVELLVRLNHLDKSFWENGTGVTAIMRVTYQNEVNVHERFSIMHASADTQSSLPANPGIDYAGKAAPVYNNGWSFVAFPAGSITESQAITDFYLMAHSGNQPLWTAAKDGVGAWSDPNMFHIYGATGQETNWGAKGSIATGGNYVVGHRYTAPYAGYANIDITKLMFANIGSGVNNVNVPGLVSVAIFVDNQKIWPADDSWFTSDNFNSDVSAVAMAAAGDALADIYLSRGSTVDLLVRSNYDSIAGITGDRYFKTRGTMFSAAIDYTTICPIYADITPSLHLGDAFAIHATVESERNYTIKLGDETVLTAPGSVTKSYTNISAKNVDQDIPYQILDGDRVLRKGMISVDALLGLYEQHEDTAVAELADATMLYGAMADAYFNSSALTKVEQSALADLAAPKEAAASITDEVEEQVTFQGATLLLNDTIDMKITFKGEVTGALKVQFAYTDGSAATTVDAVLVGDTYQAVLSVPMSAYDKTLDITVLDEEGNAISETLTYGVGVYAYRVYSNAANAENTALLNVLKAISALGEKATAYQAAQQ